MFFSSVRSLLMVLFMVFIIVGQGFADEIDYRIVSTIPSPGPSPQGMAWDGTHLWLSDDSTDTIYNINPLNGFINSSFSSPGSEPRGLTYDGTYLWNIDNNSRKIFKLKPENGSIINFGSIYGVVGPDFSIYQGTDMTVAAAYSAIKGGIISFTRYLATYYAKCGIRVNAICPGGIFDNQPQTFVKKYEKKTPMGRMGKAEEMVGPVIFLASDAASYVTGHILMVDGGWTVW